VDFFVPLDALMKKTAFEASVRLPRCDSPEFGPEFLNLIDGLPAGSVDCRVFSDKPCDIYLRFLGFESPSSREAEAGNEIFPEFDPLSVAKGLEKWFLDLPSQYVKGGRYVSILQLDSVLPPDILAALPLQGPAGILLFERLPHVFDVNTKEYTIRVSPRREESSIKTYTPQNTPTLLAVRYIQSLIISAGGTVPLDSMRWERDIPAPIKSRLLAVFSSKEDFFAAHPSEFFVQDGAVGMARIAMVPMAGAELTPREIAKEIFKALPLSGGIHWNRLRSSRFVTKVPSTILTQLTRKFFTDFRDLFEVYNTYSANGFIVARRGAPRDEFCVPPAHTVGEVLRIIAECSLGGAHEARLLCVLPDDARKIVKECGGLERLVRQVPEWFDVKNPRRKYGESIITYIGDLAAPGSRVRE
jgi:hypothetical protein